MADQDRDLTKLIFEAQRDLSDLEASQREWRDSHNGNVDLVIAASVRQAEQRLYDLKGELQSQAIDTCDQCGRVFLNTDVRAPNADGLCSYCETPSEDMDTCEGCEEKFPESHPTHCICLRCHRLFCGECEYSPDRVSGLCKDCRDDDEQPDEPPACPVCDSVLRENQVNCSACGWVKEQLPPEIEQAREGVRLLRLSGRAHDNKDRSPQEALAFGLLNAGQTALDLLKVAEDVCEDQNCHLQSAVLDALTTSSPQPVSRNGRTVTIVLPEHWGTQADHGGPEPPDAQPLKRGRDYPALCDECKTMINSMAYSMEGHTPEEVGPGQLPYDEDEPLLRCRDAGLLCETCAPMVESLTGGQ